MTLIQFLEEVSDYTDEGLEHDIRMTQYQLECASIHKDEAHEEKMLKRMDILLTEREKRRVD